MLNTYHTKAIYYSVISVREFFLVKTPILYHQCSFVQNSLNVRLDTRGITVIPLLYPNVHLKQAFFVVPPPRPTYEP